MRKLDQDYLYDVDGANKVVYRSVSSQNEIIQVFKVLQ